MQRAFLCASLVLVCICGDAGAQAMSVIEGRVVGTDRRPLENVVVRVTDNPALFGVTDASGRYQIIGVTPGTYVLRATRLGSETGIDTIAIGDGRHTLDFVLADAPTTLAPVAVSATREARSRHESSLTVDVLDGGDVRAARAAHPAQIMKRVPGVYVAQLSGEGHSTAIRQPITTKPMYLYLEDGIPTRPTGFFNHNALYEVNIPQSGGIEVVKGPGTALHGSDAIGGVVNVLTRGAPAVPTIEANLEGGGYGYARALISGGFLRGMSGVRADLNITRMDGWRENSPYDRQSASLRWDRLFRGWSARTVITGTRVEQNDVLALTQEQFDARDPVNRSPVAHRRATAARWSTAFEREHGSTLWSITPFARHNVLELLPSWQLTYDPQTWDTRSNSAGLLAKYRREYPDQHARIIAGADFDWSPGSFLANRAELQTTGTGADRVFQSYTTGATHYDYDVTWRQASPYVHAEWAPSARVRMDAGARFDVVGYDYETHLTPVDTGAHRVPPSTSRTYTRLSPKAGLSYDVSPSVNVFTSYRAGFRAPSQSQLFQQNTALNTVDLRPVKATSFEGGVRGQVGARTVYQLSLYDMTVNDDIVTLVTATGSRIATNAGETSHRGVEAGVGYAITSTLRADVAASVSEQKYVRWVPQEARAATDDAPAVPEVRYDGKTIEAAPSQLGNALVTWSPRWLRGGRVAAEWTHTGSYWMDPGNTREYDGYDLVHLHANAIISPRLELFMRVLNLTDENYAELAAYTPFQGVQMTPGTPRSVYAGVRVAWQGGN